MRFGISFVDMFAAYRHPRLGFESPEDFPGASSCPFLLKEASRKTAYKPSARPLLNPKPFKPYSPGRPFKALMRALSDLSGLGSVSLAWLGWDSGFRRDYASRVFCRLSKWVLGLGFRVEGLGIHFASISQLISKVWVQKKGIHFGEYG